ncbi:fibronectin type III domain-containing protein [Chryseobacterium sp. MDT2-18]|uniref:fibronectin type III domain-containing protein n=1 Tax=Chryseobacterium sp. MDT2-18 TaxID=1259136 RepID=UPI0027823782|nr:fibronectin type III domain-containing protein [Chryseobacterium sp. MDT2-18]MDQ0476233.1 hypothetical protein [Chryseobacterium sp. MDT2-18]
MKFLYLFVLICCVFSCSEREDVQTKEPEINQPPSQVNFNIDSVSHNFAYISWEPAVDPENDEVKYSIELNGQKLMENSKERTYRFQNLEELKSYNGKIIATDIYKNSNSTTFAFQTKKYYLTFLRNYKFPGPDLTSGAATNILKLSDGNYLMGGYVYFDRGYSVFLMKTDYDGNVIWKKNYDIDGESSPSTFKMKESKGEIIIAASYTVAKLDLNGMLKWKNRINTYDNGYGNSTINSFAIDSQDNIYVVGTLADDSDDINEKGLISKLSKDGNKIWEKEYISHMLETGGKSRHLRFMDVDIQDDQLVIFGDVSINNSFSTQQVYYLFKTNLDGNAISEKIFANTGVSYQLVKRKNGNYLLSSSQNIMEIDKSGKELWAKTFYNHFTPYDMFFSVKETPSGNLLFIGKEDKGLYNGTYFLTDSKGNIIWKKYFKDPPNYTMGLDVVLENDGGFRLAFLFARYHSYKKWYEEVMIIKTNPEGNY